MALMVPGNRVGAPGLRRKRRPSGTRSGAARQPCGGDAFLIALPSDSWSSGTEPMGGRGGRAFWGNGGNRRGLCPALF